MVGCGQLYLLGNPNLKCHNLDVNSNGSCRVWHIISLDLTIALIVLLRVE